MPARPAWPTWRQRARVLFWPALAVFVILACGIGLIPQPPDTFHGQNCGTVNVGPNGTIAGDPQPPEDCFVSAFTRCQSARLTFNSSGVDFGQHHELQVVPAAKGCVIEDRPSSSSAVPGLIRNSLSPPVNNCESVKSVAEGLAVNGCNGEDDFVIPLYPAAVGQGCGRIFIMQDEVRSDPPDALRCFWQAYTICQPATLIVDSATILEPRNVAGGTMFITFQPLGGVCAVSLVERATDFTIIPHTCAGLVERDSQAIVSACGTLGDVLLPLSLNAPSPWPHP